MYSSRHVLKRKARHRIFHHEIIKTRKKKKDITGKRHRNIYKYIYSYMGDRMGTGGKKKRLTRTQGNPKDFLDAWNRFYSSR